MASQLKNLFQARESGNLNLVDRGIRRGITRNVRNNGGSHSPTEEDFDRIADDYIDSKWLNNIFDEKTSRRAMNSLNKKTNLDLSNFFLAINKQDFVDRLLDRYKTNRIDILNKNTFILKSGKEIKGIKVNSKTYLIAVNNKYIKARSFKTGKFVKFNRKYYSAFYRNNS